jgi:hypothetical protein
MEAKKQYHIDYYQNKYKEVLKNKKLFCENCKKEVQSWNIYKHKISKKHILNSMDENEYKKYLAEKVNQKFFNIQKSIHEIEQLIS